MTTAAWWFRHQVHGLLRRLQDPRWELVLAVTPDHAGMHSRVWPKTLPRLKQGGGNLGARMARALASVPHGPVCVIGADIPGICKPHIARAFAALGDYEAVLGPATDGGYWLIGLKNARPAPLTMFQRVRWSSKHALQDTIASLGDIRIAFIDELRDVDSVKDLRMTTQGTRAT
jgi:glycosyltransferase A (GT-A) superfamily protein (DUF2064 family)